MEIVRWFVSIGIVLAGCGRVNFDALGGGGAVDAPEVVVRRCPLAATTPSAITLSGKTIRILATGFPVDESDVEIQAIDRVGGTMLAQTTSGNNGDFTLMVPTGGQAILPFVQFAKSNLMTSVFVPDEVTNDSVAIPIAYMGSPTAVDSLYSVVGENRDPTKGTILFMMRDCAGSNLEGVTITVDPPPGRIVYSGGVGIPNAGTTSSRSPYAMAWALNAEPGPTTINAAQTGSTFGTQVVEVLPGDWFMGTVVRPLQ